jgi:hypothetical protein
MVDLLKSFIGYPDEIPETLFRYALTVGILLLIIRITDDISRRKKERKAGKRVEEDEDDDWDYIR